MKKKNEKIKHGRVMDKFFNNQINKIFDVQKVEKSLGEKYLINGQKIKDHKKEILNGTLERYCIDEECEIIILKTMGKLKQTLINPKGTYKNIRLLYCFGGEATFLSLTHEGIQRDFYLKKGELLIQRASSEINKYEISGNNFEFITIEFYLDKLISNLLKITGWEKIKQWKEKNLNIFEPGNFYYGKLNMEIEVLMKEIQNITIIRSINKYLNLKAKIFQLLPMILDMQTNLVEIMPVSSLEIVNKTKEIIKRYSISEMPMIKDLCKMMNISRYQLHTSFKKIEGISISDYIQKKKMEHGKFLLSSTDKTILDIANEIGYENPSKFSEAFKKYFGILPNKFRKNI
ncbi:AraC family transcriptional regulator [Leptotrichia sp. OH3620_COT-345]|uniref:helix-turn-helix domain-containing protein n=1 Tax=Leptotrichia sp. OH3620_COT-345 TaxID=2491048 RepID=UPI000F6458F8|nr:helix-turn-helix transcriptional regulator [Leptotrichia sp. OH3620_COT-345]RRD38840.1 AraC family transcriptional regulator [Leptotrichia sp. OH3620_COT-345]